MAGRVGAVGGQRRGGRGALAGRRNAGSWERREGGKGNLSSAGGPGVRGRLRSMAWRVGAMRSRRRAVRGAQGGGAAASAAAVEWVDTAATRVPCRSATT